MTALSKLKDEFAFIKGNILINTVTLAIILVTTAIPYTYYPKFIEEGLGGDPTIVGVIGFAAYATLAIVQIPGGYLADKHGRRKLTIAMTFGIAFTYFLYSVAPNWQFFIIPVILQNMFYIYQPALQALVADSTPPQRRGMSFSIINLLHYISIPSPIIAGVLAAELGLIPGMRIAYVMVAAAFIVAAFIRMKFKETLTSAEQTPKLKETLKKIPESIVESIQALKNATKSMKFLFASFAIYHFAWFMCSLNLIFYATEVIGIEELQWAALMAWFSVVNILAALPCGKIVDRFGRKKPLMFSWLLFIPALIGFVYGNIVITSVSFMLLGVALITANSAYPALMADLVAREKRGKIIGSTNFFFNILSALGQLAGGFMYQHVAPELPFLIPAVLFVPCFLLILFKVQEPKNKEI